MTRNAIYKAAAATSLLATLLLAACGGSDGSGTAAGSATSSSSSVATSTSSSSVTSTSSSVASSASSSSESSSSSSTIAAGTKFPANGATAAFTDTTLQLTFDATPTLGSSGYVYVYKASDDTLVDKISVDVFSTGSWVDNATSTTPTSFTSTVLNSFTSGSTTTDINSQTAIPDLNTEVDCIGCNISGMDKFRWVFYAPFAISGKTATIKLHDGKLAASTAYYVKMDSGVLNGTINGTTYAGISDKTTWAFTTKAAATSYTDLTVDAAGSGDFLTVQGALNQVMAGSSKADATVAKKITIKNGTYNELLFVRNVANLTITGESRDGVVVKYDNYDEYNPGVGGSQKLATVLTDTSNGLGRKMTEGFGTRPYLAGGRAVLLAEAADLLTLNQFTLKNSHVKTATTYNQAETIYYNSSALTGSRWMGTYMNFISTQDTIQSKGWMWIYKSLVKGDVDFVWGAVFGGLLEDSELRTVVDTTSASSGGYVTEARAAYGYPGFVILNSSLTREAGVPDGATYLARQAGNFTTTTYCNAMYTTASSSFGNANYGCNNIAYINTKMDSHIKAAGWYAYYTVPLAVSATTGYRESGSMDLSGNALSMSGRDTAISSSSLDLSGLNTRAKVFAQWNSSAGWSPTATTCISSACTTSQGKKR